MKRYATLLHDRLEPSLVVVLAEARGHAVVIDYMEDDQSENVRLVRLDALTPVRNDFGDVLKDWTPPAVTYSLLEKARASLKSAERAYREAVVQSLKTSLSATP